MKKWKKIITISTMVIPLVVAVMEFTNLTNIFSEKEPKLPLDKRLFNIEEVRVIRDRMKDKYRLANIFIAQGIREKGVVTKMRMNYESADRGFGIFRPSKSKIVDVDDEVRVEFSRALTSDNQCLTRFVKDIEDGGVKSYLNSLGVKTHMVCVLSNKNNYMMVAVMYWDEEIVFTQEEAWTFKVEMGKLRKIFRAIE